MRLTIVTLVIVVVVIAARVAVVVPVAARVAYAAIVAVTLFANSFVTRLALPHLDSLPSPSPSPAPFPLPPLAVDSLIHHFV